MGRRKVGAPGGRVSIRRLCRDSNFVIGVRTQIPQLIEIGYNVRNEAPISGTASVVLFSELEGVTRDYTGRIAVPPDYRRVGR